MAWGKVTIGGIDLRETLSAEESQGTNGPTLRVAGQESRPPSSLAHVIAAHHNVLACAAAGRDGQVLPVVFSDKANLTGFYLCTEAASNLLRHANGAVQAATWQVTLERIGGERDVEVESRVPTVPRATDHPVTPVHWHAPAAGASGYYTGPVGPAGRVDRQSEDGVVRVHLGLPSGVSPRWTVPARSFMAGAARLEFDGLLHLGTVTPSLAVWAVSNGLVRVMSGPAGGVTVSSWDGQAGEWVSGKGWQFTVAGAPVSDVPELTVLRNTPEEVLVRLTYPQPGGRLTVDLGVRRGSRFVTGIIKRHAPATLGVRRTAAEAGTAQTGGVMATAADADGNRYVVGSARTVTRTTSPGGISRAGAAVLDFYAGHQVGASPATGDGYADLLAQYVGSTGERSRVVAR